MVQNDFLSFYSYICPGRRARIAPTNGGRDLRLQQQQQKNHQRNRHHDQKRRATPLSRRIKSTSSNDRTVGISSASSGNSSDDESKLKIKENKQEKKKQEEQKEKEEEDGDAMQARLDWKLALVYTLLVLQVLVFMIYVASTPHDQDQPNASSLRSSVSFVEIQTSQQIQENKSTPELRIVVGEISLRDIKTSSMFRLYNGTLCWGQGVDAVRMQREASSPSSNYVNSGEQQQQMQQRCICDAGWHGADCGQPEVVWRAIMASKQMAKLRRRKYARRLVHTFHVDDYNSALAEVIVEELYHVVDLFVICDLSTAEDNFRHKLAKGFLAKQQDKILYVNVASKTVEPTRFVSKYVWDRIKKTVRNIRDDDIYVSTDSEQILNSRALMFLKIYDGWPQPIGFRLRWSVFGFFWQHPHRTSIAIGASTVGLMRELHRNLQNQQSKSNEVLPTLQEREHLGLVIGDLNHYGGWYCQFCQGPANVIVALRQKNKTREMIVDRSVDVPYIEELIGSGTWFDEKTSLLRASRSRESYYAPETVMNQTWKYDWLVENFYAKLDYY